MQSVLSRIWTRDVVSISYDDNHYTTGTSFALIIITIKLSDNYCLQITYTNKWVSSSFLTNTLGEGIDPSFLPSSYG